MKRAVSLFLTLVMVLGVFVSMPFTKIQANAADVTKLFTVKTSGVVKDEVVYTIYLNKGVSLSGAIFYIKFDPAVLSVVKSEYKNAVMVDDGDGGLRENIGGVYEADFIQVEKPDGTFARSNDTYSIAHATSLAGDYKSDKADKAYMEITFKVIAKGAYDTKVSFYCHEYHNNSVPANNIANGSDVLLASVSANHTHSYGDWVVEKKATCTAEGSKYKACSCGDKIVEKIAKTGHTSSDWITDKKATTSVAGSKHKECTSCKAVLETAKIPQLKCSKPKLKTIANTADGVKITWGKVSGADSYAVYRKTGSKGKYSKLTTTTKTGYTDKSAKSGKKYYYIVKAVNEAGSSSASSSKSIYYLADTTLKTPKSTKSGVTLNWTQITGADGYMVYRKTGSGDYKKIATVKGVKKVKYTDKSAKKGKTYTYKIKAYKSKTYSAYSNAKKIKDKY